MNRVLKADLLINLRKLVPQRIEEESVEIRSWMVEEDGECEAGKRKGNNQGGREVLSV